MEPRARAQLNDLLYALDGSTITGRYMGQPYHGTVTSTRQVTTRPYQAELTIALSHPLTVFGHTRAAGEHILIDGLTLEHSAYGPGSETATIDGLDFSPFRGVTFTMPATQPQG